MNCSRYWVLAMTLFSQSMALATPLPEVSAGSLHRLQDVPFSSIPSRPVDVWLPEHAQGQQLAVLYMHDGQMLFDATTTWNGQEWRVDEVAQQLIDAGKTRPFMVVAIHNGGPHRHAEYFPQQPFDNLAEADRQRLFNYQQQAGVPVEAPYSDKYLRFLVQELKPYIDSHYPVDGGPESTFIMGSSMGGLISMYALTQYPEVFGGAACLSTHWPGVFEMADNPLPAALLSYLQQSLPKANSRRLYFDYGDQTLDALYPPLQRQADAIMQARGWQAPYWLTEFFSGAGHTEQAWADRLEIPLQFLLGTIQR
ncbi:alpha/beta hydrolase [Shewanella sp. GXUN23E]|uniref:alpha/beta hydrolase n=1 Tax=Shewanella sp. GXUN23E TaxID=3422498 RepID=UPI003D7CB555